MPAPRTVFVVLTRSDELLEQIGQVLDDAGEVRHAENEEEARQFADPRHAAVMLLDARENADPDLLVERLHSSDGSTVIVVFAPADAVADVARAIRGSAAFAVLPIPVEMEKTRAVLHGAGEEAMARRALLASAMEAMPVGAAPDVPPPHREAQPERPLAVSSQVDAQHEVPAPPGPVAPAAAGGASRGTGGIPRVALAVAAGLLVAAVAAWFHLRDESSPPEKAVAEATAPPAALGEPEAPQTAAVTPSRPARPLSTEPKDELLDQARVAFHERRYTDPDGDNALYYYRSVLAQDPQDGEAREGLDRIGSVLDGRLNSALVEQRTEDAARTLEQLRSIRPDDVALAATEARITEGRIAAALARGDLERAATLLRTADQAGVAPERLATLREQLARLDAAQRAEQLSRMVGARIRDGRLLAPPGDNAKHYLGQLLALSNGKRIGAEAAGELARAFAERARRAAAQGQGAEADQWFEEARALGYSPERPVVVPAVQTAAAPVLPDASTMQRPADSSIPVPRDPGVLSQPTRGATAEPVARPETLAASYTPSSPAVAAVAPEVSAADFRRTRFVAPTYPPQALSRGLRGEVRVQITVDTEGRVVDAQVLSASPAQVFDEAAVNAVRKWRFEPVVKDGRRVEASIATTIRFQPEDAQR